MKKLSVLMALLLMNSLSLHANEDITVIDSDEVEITQDSNIDEEARITIKEIKNFVETADKSTTCMDEYLKRRKQLMTKLVLSPVVGTAAGAASVYVGGAAGAGLAVATNVRDWGALGYIILGAGGGLITSTAYVLYDTTKSTFEIVDNNLMLKALAEQHMNVDGPKSEKLYQKYLKHNPRKNLSRVDFFDRLMAADQDGSLCDGSLVKQPKVRLGFKLKYQLTSSKNFAKKI